jgi:signal transduction histidine kinase/CheY-like chemotaxis protein
MSTEKNIASAPVAKKSKPIILCVDDQKTVLETLDAQISMHLGKNFKIEIAESGNEALELLEDLHQSQREVAVIISDYLMPNSIPGDEFLIAAHKIYPDARKIMLTGQANLHAVGNAINHAKLFRYIEKPWEDSDLRMTVEEAAQSYLMSIELDEKNKILRLLHEASQTIASQNDIRKALDELTGQILHYSAAERCVILLVEDDQLKVQAVATASGDNHFLQNQLPEEFGSLPVTDIRHAETTGETAVYNDAYNEGQDAYFKTNNSKSVLILPTRNMGKVNAVFFLENNSYTKVFNPDRVEIITTLANSAAVALDNARLYEHMENLVNERTEQLSDTTRSKVVAESHKDKMVHIVSHDIRSPLSGIAGLTKLLQEDENAKNAEQVKRYAEIITDSVNTVIRFVEDILDLAKLESGNIELITEDTSVGEYIKSLGKTFEPLTMTKGVELVVDVQADSTVKIDKSKLSQSINNLLSNAIKFTKKGGKVSLIANKATENGKNFATIQVKDTGMGIPKEELPNIFEKFNKFQRSGARGEKGTGLGMSIAKEIVEMHKGHIAADSEVGVGTTFTIYLPIN